MSPNLNSSLPPKKIPLEKIKDGSILSCTSFDLSQRLTNPYVKIKATAAFQQGYEVLSALPLFCSYLLICLCVSGVSKDSYRYFLFFKNLHFPSNLIFPESSFSNLLMFQAASVVIKVSTEEFQRVPYLPRLRILWVVVKTHFLSIPARTHLTSKQYVVETMPIMQCVIKRVFTITLLIINEIE